ncbi:MAG: class III lanthionine synthetase LanKC [Pseudonocardiaceae bacterium]
MDKRYEVYCHTDPLFYDLPTQAAQHSPDYAVGRAPVPDGWERSVLESWLVHQPRGVTFPQQGWKVHVSACLDNADDVLSTVARYCTERAIPFKYLRGPDHLLLANAKYAHRGASGKFITIYPLDETMLQRVLVDLDAALAGSQGPYVLSDLRFGDGPLYVRYGGFAERWCVSGSGALELAIEEPDGTLVPDRREPIFRSPPWVTLPEFLAPHLEARNTLTVAELPYQIERALHFSNGGGVYAGRELATGAAVVLKEARPHAGLDTDGSDAVTRLRRERDVLHRLAGLDVVPAVHGEFTLGEHSFLALEFIEGTELRSLIVERYPLVQLDADRQAAADYTAWALDMQDRVERAVAEVHACGVVIGDLHPFNVLLRPDGRVALIDFEVAGGIEEGRRQTLADPGFVAPHDRTGFDIDRYALACQRLFLFLPLTTLLSLDLSKSAEFADVIACAFPVPREFLDDAVRVITGDAVPRRPAPRRAIAEDPLDWPRIRSALATAILASATPERDDRLFPGDIEQFSTGGLNLAHGAAGVLYALDVTGAGRYPELEEWLVHRAVRPGPGTRLGLYDGLHGVAHVLEHLGHRSEALKVLDICATELDGRLDRLGHGLHGGLAGIGLNLAHFAAATGDPALREAAMQVAQVVADGLGGEDDVGTVSGGRHPYAGLMHGSAGVALLFLRLYEQTGRPALLDLAAVALRQDLKRCFTRSDGTLEVNEGWRTMPYLAEGSVGIGMVLEHYLGHRDDERFAGAAAAIRRAALSPFYVEPGLFDGRAGMVVHLSRSCPASAAEQVRRLDWHAIDHRGGVAFPGEELLRLSMDLATGTAGVLLAVGAALHPEPVALPFLAPHDVGPDATEASTADHEKEVM